MYREMPSIPRTALLVVDLQNDFCAGGALAVPEGDRVVEPVNRLLAAWAAARAPIFASRDWHPRESSHFSDGGGQWPVHCVADTPGAAFHPRLRLPDTALVVSKGQAPDGDGYSAFDGTLPAGETLTAALAERNVAHLTVCGLATDYCVRASVLDARARGLAVSVVLDAVAAVDLQPGAGTAALDEMRAAGAEVVSPEDALARLGDSAS